MNAPLANLGPLTIADQLLQAREKGAHRDGELAMVHYNQEYSYTGIFGSGVHDKPGSDDPFSYLSQLNFTESETDAKKTFVNYNRNR